jgi:enoyl-CoA hydratase/carnithine racemase
MKLGFLPQPSDPGRMVALMGPARTKLMLMGGQKITAEEALSFGLIDRIVEEVALLDVARSIAVDTLAAKPDFVSTMKGMCR